MLLFAEFPTVEDYQAFVAYQDEIDAQADLDDALIGRVRLRTTVDVPVPLFESFPTLGNQPLRESPAIALYNGIKNNELGPPMEYIADAVPLAQSMGSQFFRPFTILEVLEGQYDFHLVFITEWRSVGGLNKFHHRRDWLSIVPNRNSHFSNLIEAYGKFDL